MLPKAVKKFLNSMAFFPMDRYDIANILLTHPASPFYQVIVAAREVHIQSQPHCKEEGIKLGELYKALTALKEEE